MGKVYGYCRVSTKKQKIERQVANILNFDGNAIIYQERFTGTKLYERKELNKLLKRVEPNDTIVFDSVSRMSRNADDGISLYLDLFSKGINLIFLNERYIDTSTYQEALQTNIKLTGDDVDIILTAITEYLKKLATKQIKLAFEQAQKERDDLSQRTKEGLREAKKQGRVGGLTKGKTLTTKKSIKAKEIILNRSKDFRGDLSDSEVILLAQISRNSFYKYKAELAEEYAHKVEQIE